MAEQLFKKQKSVRKKRDSQKRKQLSETWLFICEGEKTEPNYIKTLVKYANEKTKVSHLKIKIVGTGLSTVNLVNKADALMAAVDDFNIKTDIPYGKVFIVFDKDSFKDSDFNNAVSMAKARKNHFPIWSNECFELWYLLHYDYFDSDIGRDTYFKKLSEYLKIKNYEEKKSLDVFSQIAEKTGIALKNADRLNGNYHDKIPPAKRVPSTQMPILIRELEERLKIVF